MKLVRRDFCNHQIKHKLVVIKHIIKNTWRYFGRDCASNDYYVKANNSNLDVENNCHRSKNKSRAHAQS